MDYPIEIPGLPQEELTHNLFRLMYNIGHENMRMNGTIEFSFKILIEATYLKKDHPLNNLILETKYEAATSPYSNSTIFKFDPVMEQLRRYVIEIRNNIFNIINLPLEDIPLHINDPEPYNDLAHWRLYLPKPNLTPHYAFAYRDVALLPD